jgi:hypothetical protein
MDPQAQVCGWPSVQVNDSMQAEDFDEVACSVRNEIFVYLTFTIFFNFFGFNFFTVIILKQHELQCTATA